MPKQVELSQDQKHFDEAWHARERRRATLGDAHNQAAGPRAAAAQVRRGAEKVLEGLGRPDEAVAFGRFDLADGETVYIGKHLITDDTRNALVINWKVDFAEPYFAATYDDPCGIRMRRKFSTDRNTVTDFEELVFQDVAERVGELTGLERAGLDDTVLRDLDKHRTGEMQDIVQTIHASQYRLVRSTRDQLLIIQGGPGTGKTAVALHRVSWLLFNHLRDLPPEDVLVVGPNPTFTKYIKSVLPGLGDNEVAHRDLQTLGPQPSSARQEDAQTARLKGDGRMADFLATALRQRARVPDRMDDLEVGRGSRVALADLEDVLRRFGDLPYTRGRAAARRHIADLVERRTGSVDAAAVDSGLERIWPSLTPQAFLRDLLGSRERLVAAAGDDFTAGDVNRLLRTPTERISEETWSDADVALLDEVDHLMTGDSPTFAHLVVDEAQDLSPMQLRSLRRRSRNGSMTVVGDVAQSTGPWARDSWDDIGVALKRDAPIVVEELALGYRVPNQVFQLAVQLLPEAAPGIVPPRVIRQGPEEPRLEHVDVDDVVPQAIAIAKDHAGNGRFVGVVCPASLREELLSGLNSQKVAFSDASRGGIGSSINIVSPAEAKGLEFDAVVVLEPERIVSEHDRGLRMLYVAFTRTTQFLAVVHSGRVLPLTSAPTTEPKPLPPAVEQLDVAESTSNLAPPIASGPSLPNEVGASDQQRTAQDAVAKLPTPIKEALPATSRDLADLNPEASTPVQVGSHSPTPVPPAPLATPTGDFSVVLAAAAATALAGNVRTAVAPELWPHVVDQLRRQLGVTLEQLMDLLD